MPYADRRRSPNHDSRVKSKGTHVTTFRSLSATTFRSIGGGWRFTYALVVEDVMKKNAHCWAA